MINKVITKRIKRSHHELSKACTDNDFERVKSLCSKEVDLTEFWTTEEYPLVYALAFNNADIVRCLLEHDMPMYHNDNYGATQAQEYGCTIEDTTLVNMWSPEHHELIKCMIQKGALVNSPCIWFNPVLKLVKLTDSENCPASDEFFDILIEHNIDVDMSMPTWGSLLCMLVGYQNTKYVPALVRRSKDVNAQTCSIGKPALFSAIAEGSHVGVNVLLECGADPNRVSEGRDKTALDYAYRIIKKNKMLNASGKIDRIVDSLLKCGAKTYDQMDGQ